MNTVDVFAETSAVYSALADMMDLVLEGLQRVRTEAAEDADFSEEAGALLAEASGSLEDLKRLQSATGRLAELARKSRRNIEKILSEERVIYPEPEFGISTFESLAPHEKLMPFEKRRIEKTAKLDEEVLV